MGIGHYLKEIGRGKDGARALSRQDAEDLFVAAGVQFIPLPSHVRLGARYV
jgi:hypothetical protein